MKYLGSDYGQTCPWQSKNGLETLTEFNPDKFPLFAAKFFAGGIIAQIALNCNVPKNSVVSQFESGL
jgi:hypothetical protein